MTAISDTRDVLPGRPVLLDGPTQAVILRDVQHMSDGAYVTVPGLDPGIRFGPCRWQARDATSKPARGNACLLLIDDQDDPWIVAWWPYGNVA